MYHQEMCHSRDKEWDCLLLQKRKKKSVAETEIRASVSSGHVEVTQKTEVQWMQENNTCANDYGRLAMRATVYSVVQMLVASCWWFAWRPFGISAVSLRSFLDERQNAFKLTSQFSCDWWWPRTFTDTIKLCRLNRTNEKAQFPTVWPKTRSPGWQKTSG